MYFVFINNNIPINLNKKLQRTKFFSVDFLTFTQRWLCPIESGIFEPASLANIRHLDKMHMENSQREQKVNLYCLLCSIFGLNNFLSNFDQVLLLVSALATYFLFKIDLVQNLSLFLVKTNHQQASSFRIMDNFTRKIM